MMTNDVDDIEEGEIVPDEITEYDFNKAQQDLLMSNDNKVNHDFKTKEDSKTRVSDVHDLYLKYPSVCRAQAVQNCNGNDDNSNRLASSSVKEDNVSVNGNVVIDVDKEDGELEEGEIDVDADLEGGNVSQCVLSSEEKSVMEVLKGFTIANVEESFAESCGKLQSALQSLCTVSDKDNVLVRMSFNAIQVIYSLFCSMENSQKENNKGYILRLLSFVKDQQAHLFALECLKQDMITTLDSNDALVNSEAIVKEKESHSNDMKTLEIQDRRTGELISSSKHLDSISIGAPEALKFGQSNFNGRGVFDLHKNHDIDSLPTPTREAPSCFPVNNSFSVEEGMVRPGLPTHNAPNFPLNKSFSVGEGMVRFGFPASMIGTVKMEVNSEGSKLHPCVTDALEDVSSYQQKFGRSSLFTSEELPSPTPSGDCEDAAIDTNKEVSSASVAGCFINSDAIALDLNHQHSMVKNMPKVENARTIISRKQKATEEPPLDDAVSKRLKTSSENFEHSTRDPRTAAGNYGWLEETTPVGSQLIERNRVEAEPKKTTSTVNSSCTGSSYFNVTSNVNQQVSVATSNASVSISANANSAMGMSPIMSIGTSMTTRLQQNSVGMLPVSSPATTAGKSIHNDSRKIRLKPRDPRRILHGNTLPEIGGLGREQSKAIVSLTLNNQGTGDNISAPKLEVRPDTKLVPSQSSASLDIAGQFTKNLKNIADIISVTQPSSNDSPALQSFSSAPVLASDRVEQKLTVSSSQNLQAGVGSVPETCASVSSTPQSTWRDAVHLFEGYDEKQKATILRERARRIEEQNKMFAARKLCLVLDLDHTLLNSAKFVEVDLVQDKILRKKEEQDREMPHRHLFCFPHMGMWTKLRPGIWNFLEKASKLFELHVYTMGNKLYATEMAKVLDPKGTLFNGRVIARGDDTDSSFGEERTPKIKDLEGVLGMESAVVIIDDTMRVWPHNKLNLIVVERYIYFPSSRRQFGLPGPSLLESDRDEIPEAGTLASSLRVIERIHQNFFASQSLEEVDVRNILASEQRKILAGCRIVFSRVIPVAEVNPHLHPLWQTAEQFGAVCTNHIDDQVTHVVANSHRTDKVKWALSTGRFVVHPNWVEASALLYRRADEQIFSIK